jgi:hypothetical protein
MNAEQKAEALRLADVLDRRDCTIELVALWQAAALLRTLAAEPQSDPVAWLYTCQKPGNQMKYSSVDDNDTYHWPVDQWKSIVKSALYLHPSLAAEPQSEPVAWVDPLWLTSGGSSEDMFMETQPHPSCEWVPLYLHPAPAQTPLTDDDKRDAER